MSNKSQRINVYGKNPHGQLLHIKIQWHWQCEHPTHPCVLFLMYTMMPGRNKATLSNTTHRSIMEIVLHHKAFTGPVEKNAKTFGFEMVQKFCCLFLLIFLLRSSSLLAVAPIQTERVVIGTERAHLPPGQLEGQAAHSEQRRQGLPTQSPGGAISARSATNARTSFISAAEFSRPAGSVLGIKQSGFIAIARSSSNSPQKVAPYGAPRELSEERSLERDQAFQSCGSAGRHGRVHLRGSERPGGEE